ncbi:hypothetical protein, partial [Segatella copri]|uniref:hypothetical protein n=1 Tax=Segatella copri TaxID=165179 RepID=UPI001C38514A
MQSLENSQAKTRADESSTSTALKNSPFTYLDISLIPTNGTGKTIVFRQVKAEMTDNFGHVSMRVPVGEYDMVAVASKNADVKINSVTEVVFPNKVTDMAAVCQKIMVKDGNNAFNCDMKRSVAKFTIENTGATTDVVKKMKFRISGNCSNKWNPTTGLAADVSVVTPTIEMNNTISRLHTYVFLSSAEEENIKVDVEMLDSEGTLLKSLSFENVHLKTNYVTKYTTGDLFGVSSSADFTFSNAEFMDS